jgi:hypothetical protein
MTLDAKTIYERAGLDPATRTAVAGAAVTRRVEQLYRDLRPQPAFTFEAADFDASFQNWLTIGGQWPAQYWAGIDGAVHLSGLVGPVGSVSFAPSMPIVLLPEPFRPITYTQGPFVVESSGGGVNDTCQIQVTTDGWVRVGNRGGPANPIDWIALTGILFRTT